MCKQINKQTNIVLCKCTLLWKYCMPMLRSHEWENNNAWLITNSEETITSLRWRTVQIEFCTNLVRKTVNHHSTCPDLLVGSHMLTTQKLVSQCYIIQRFVRMIAQQSEYYTLLDIFGGLYTIGTGQRICVNWRQSINLGFLTLHAEHKCSDFCEQVLPTHIDWYDTVHQNFGDMTHQQHRHIGLYVYWHADASVEPYT